MKLPFTMAMLTAAAISFTQPVLASQTAQANVSAIGVQLIDLDLQDGITPSLRFLGQNLYYVVGRGSGVRNGETPADTMTEVDTNDDRAFNFQRQNATGKSQLTYAGPSDAPGVIGVSGAAQASIHNREGWNYMRYQMMQDMELSPNTRVIFFGNISGFAHNTNVVADEEVISVASFSIDMFDGNYRGVSQMVSTYGSNEQKSYQQQYRFTFDNLGNDYLQAVTYTTMWATAENLSPIPEPESWAMMGAGLLLLGALRRRRQA